MQTTILVLWAFMTAPFVGLLLETRESAWTAMIGYHLGCILVALPMGWRTGVRPSAAFLAGIALLSLSIVVSSFALAQRLLPDLRDGIWTWAAWGLKPPNDIPILLYYVGINPWVEEFYWRGGLLQPEVRQRIGQQRARLLSMLGFVPFHTVVLIKTFGDTGFILSLPVLFAGIVWVHLFERTRGLWAVAVSHQAADLGLAAVYILWLRPGLG